jgi:hypothetical protein
MIVEEIKLEKLDDSWIQDFDKIDKHYHEFYKENVYHVHVNFLYINKENEIDKITNEIFFMKNPNVVSREEIIHIIKRNSQYNATMYSLLSILKYNFTLNPEEITYFLKTSNNDYYKEQNLTIIKHVDKIDFEKTISMFQDLNTLIIIFYEKDRNDIKKENINNYTKKIYLKRTIKNQKYNRTIRNF